MSGLTRVLVLLVFGCTVATASVRAQAKRSVRFGAGLGASAPQGDFKSDASGEGFDPGWLVMGFVDFVRPGKPLGFRLDLVYADNPANAQLKSDVEADLGPGFDVKMRTVSANASAMWTFPLSSGGTNGYLLSGIGVATPSLRISSGSVSADTSETKFSWNAGAGLTFPLNPVTMFLELRYYSVSTAFELGRLPSIALTAGIRSGRSGKAKQPSTGGN